MRVSSSYLTVAFEHHSAIVEFAVAALRQIDFEIIAYRGESGALIAPAVAFVLKKKLVCVRKNRHTSHSSHEVEGWQGNARYVIVDDLVSSCRTVKTIVSQIQEHEPKMKCVGLYLYRDDRVYLSHPALESLGIKVIKGPLDPVLDDYAYEQFCLEEKAGKQPDNRKVYHCTTISDGKIAPNSTSLSQLHYANRKDNPKAGALFPFQQEIVDKAFDTNIKFVIPRDDKDIPLQGAAAACMAARLKDNLDRRFQKEVTFANTYGGMIKIDPTLAQRVSDEFAKRFPSYPRLSPAVWVALCPRGKLWWQKGWISQNNVEALAQLSPNTQLQLCNRLWQQLIATPQLDKTNGSLESLAEAALDSMLKSALMMESNTPTPLPLKVTPVGEESLPNAILPSNAEEVQTAISFANEQSSPTAGPEYMAGP